MPLPTNSERAAILARHSWEHIDGAGWQQSSVPSESRRVSTREHRRHLTRQGKQEQARGVREAQRAMLMRREAARAGARPRPTARRQARGERGRTVAETLAGMTGRPVAPHAEHLADPATLVA